MNRLGHCFRGMLIATALGAIAGCEESNAVYVEHLAIVNINPSHGAVGIGYDADVTVTFSEVLDISTVTSASVCLTAESAPPADPANPCGTGTPVQAGVTYDVAALSVALAPSDDLLPDERYTLHLMPLLRGEESGALPAIVRASFRTIPTD